jgi:hypothetical protein
MEKTMSENVISAATQAIFHLQLNTNDAIRYVVKEASVDAKQAGQALKQVMLGYRSK